MKRPLGYVLTATKLENGVESIVMLSLDLGESIFWSEDISSAKKFPSVDMANNFIDERVNASLHVYDILDNRFELRGPVLVKMASFCLDDYTECFDNEEKSRINAIFGKIDNYLGKTSFTILKKERVLRFISEVSSYARTRSSMGLTSDTDLDNLHSELLWLRNQMIEKGCSEVKRGL